jgi:hypothetical protein
VLKSYGTQVANVEKGLQRKIKFIKGLHVAFGAFYIESVAGKHKL